MEEDGRGRKFLCLILDFSNLHNCKTKVTNPAYGRYWISRHVRIVAPVIKGKETNGEKKRQKNVRCHMSCVTCHVSHVLCHMSWVTCYVLRVMCCASCVACHLSPVTKADGHKMAKMSRGMPTLASLQSTGKHGFQTWTDRWTLRLIDWISRGANSVNI